MGRHSELSFCGPVSGFRSFQLAPSPNSLSLSADLKGLCLQVSVVKSTCFWLGNLLAATWPLTTARPGFCAQSALSWLFCFAPTHCPLPLTDAWFGSPTFSQNLHFCVPANR